MSTSFISECAGQILDNLSDAMNTPTQGTVTIVSTQSAPLAVPKGLLGTLPDGRVIRVRKPNWVYSTGSSSAPSLARLDLLGATFGVNNFAPVTPGMIVTWQSPPTGMAATGTVATMFAAGPGNLISTAAWGTSLPNTEASLKEMLTQGTIVATLHFLGYQWAPGGGIRSNKLKYQWALRLWMSNNQGQRTRPIDLGNTVDACTSYMFDASVMSDIIYPESSREVQTKIQAWCHEIKFSTITWTPGRIPTIAAIGPNQALEDLYATILLPGDGTQTPSFQVPIDAKA
jgi:hypothetical protein